MKLSDHLHQSAIVIDDGSVSDKRALLKLIAETAIKNPILKNNSSDEIYEKLAEREKLGSTGFGKKIAIPHCSLDGISDFVIGMIISHNGIDFAALDKKKTHLFVYIIAPSEKRNLHIRYLSAISGVLRIPQAVEEILTGKEVSVVRESFLRYTSEREVEKGKKEFNLLHIFVQKEDKFVEILHLLSEVANTHISVLEANDAGKYLHALPLFSSFWNEDQKGFQRIIIAAVEKSLANDILRKINLLIESLKGKTGILVTMQNMVYLNGSLNI